jgi:hypothetical protein
MALTGLGVMIAALVLDMPALFFVPLTCPLTPSHPSFNKHVN